MVHVAVILSGCGHLDGAEIRESVLTLTALDTYGANISIFAPDIPQKDVINHLTGEPMNESRNVLVEAARIARGNIQDLQKAKASNFDALILPGGFGAAKNLSSLAETGPENISILPEYKTLVRDFLSQEKPIGAICISPAVLVAAIADETTPLVTIGDDENGMIEALGGTHQACKTKGMVIDDSNNIISCSAYMRDDAPLAEIAVSIEKLVEAIIHKVTSGKEAA